MTAAGRSGARAAAESMAALSAACHPEPTLAVTALSVALAAASGRSVAGTVAVALAVGTGQLSVGWHNDWLDAERDRAAGRRDKPLVEGRIGRPAVGAAACVACVACVPLSLLSGWEAGGAHIAAVALAWSYNARLKATVASVLPYALAFALLVAFISLGRPGQPWPAWWALTAAALLGVGAHLANAVPDLEDDVATGVCGLPQRLGRLGSVIGAAVSLTAASVVLAVGPGQPAALAAIGLVAAGAGIVAGIAFGLAQRSRMLFRATLAVALVDVGLLVAAGRSLG